jgi:hypothetical protein
MATAEADVPVKDVCNACKRALPHGTKYCEVCKSWQEKQCSVCGEWLLPNANRCNACNTYQGRVRKYFSFSQTVLALLTALISVTSPAIHAFLDYLNNESHTSIMVTGTDNGKLRTYAWNTGNKPGRLVNAVLDFGGYPYETERLEPDDPATTLIPPGGSVDSAVKGVVVEFRVGLKDQAKSKKEEGTSPALFVEVSESNDKSRRLKVPLEPSVINALIKAGGQVKE